MHRVLLLVLFAGLLGGCSKQAVEPYQRAVAIERQLLRGNPQAGYDDPGYVHVLRELAAVPKASPHHERAAALAQRISDARRIAATRAHPDIDHLPRRLAGVEPPSPPRRVRDKARDPRKATPKGPLADLSAADKKALDIVMYSASWCGYCKKARSWFAAEGLPYRELDIEKDPGANEAYQKASRGYRGVPLITVNGQPIRGFDRPKVEKAILKATSS